MKSFLIYLISIFLFTFQLDAHGPSRQKVVEKVIIDAKPEKVWNLISNFEDFSWHSDLKKIESNGNMVGSKRELTFSNNITISQSLEKLNAEKKMISWRIIDTNNDILPVNSYSATLTVTKNDENPNKSVLVFKAAFYRGFMGNDPPEHLNDENSKKKVIVFVKKSIDGIKNKLSK